MEQQLVFNIYFGLMPVFWYHICPKVLSCEIPEKAPESFLSEVVFSKTFQSKVLDFNVFSSRK